MEKSTLMVGVKMKQVVTRDIVWDNCTVLHSDTVGVVFEVHRTVADAGGNVEAVVSQVLVPWSSISHVVVMEERE